MLLLPPTYLLNPAVGAAGLENILSLPDIIVSAVLLFDLNIILTLPPIDPVKWADADVNVLATNIKLPDVSDRVTVLPAASIRVWSPVNVLDPVVAKLPVSMLPPPPLPVLTVMLNVDASPFVNVIVFKFTLAVTNELAVIADVTYDEVAASKLPILWLADCVNVFILVIELFKDAVVVSILFNLLFVEDVYEFNEEVTLAKVKSFVSCEAVNAFNELMSVVPPPPLPVLTVMLNVLASPFVNVIVFKFTLAVTNELAVIAEVT